MQPTPYTPAARFWRGLGFGAVLTLPLWLIGFLIVKASIPLFRLLFS